MERKMTNHQILDQVVALIESKALKIQDIRPIYDNSVIGFGIAPNSNVSKNTSIKPKSIKHLTITTKAYRDEGCATYKLIRYMKELGCIDEIYWRCKPEIVFNTDFDQQYTMYKGRMRLSFKSEEELNENKEFAS